MTEQGKQLLRLKGVAVEEEESEIKSDSEWILEQYRKKKASQQDTAATFDDLDLTWNPDGSLGRMTAYKDGNVLYEMDFAWNADGSLSKIMKR